MKLRLLILFLFVSCASFGQDYFYKRTTLGGASKYGQIQTSDLPSLAGIYQPLSANLTALAGLSVNGIAIRTGSVAWSTSILPSAGTALRQIQRNAAGTQWEEFTAMADPGLAIGDVPYVGTVGTPNVYNRLASIATGNALLSGGVGGAPAYGKIGLTTHVPGTLPIANGGLNLTTIGGAGTFPRSDGSTYQNSTLILPNSATSSRIVYATAANTYGESADFTFNTAGGFVTSNRTNNSSTGLESSYVVKHTRATAQDGAGPGITFVNNIAAADNFVGTIGFTRNGANGTGLFTVAPNSGGSTFTAFTLSHLGQITLGGNTTQGAILDLKEDADNGTDVAGIQAPASLASTIRVTLPSALPIGI